MRRIFLAACSLVCVIAPARPACAEWLLTPFTGVTARASTGFFDPDDAARRTKIAAGIAVSKAWRRVALEVEIGIIPGFFSGGDADALITSSRLLTMTASAVAPLPRLGPVRPYGVAGLGAVRVSMRDAADVFPVAEWQPVLDIGGGAMVPISRRIGAGIDARYFWSRRGDGSESSIGFGNTYVQFWRISARMTIGG